MAQGAVASTMASKSAQAGGSRDPSPAKPRISDELHELQQYQKILRFRDEVVNGLHPRIKPTHLGKPASSVLASTSSSASAQATMAKSFLNGDRQMANNVQAYQSNLQRPPPYPPTNFPGLGNLEGAGGPSRPYASGRLEIDPVLLEKSDDLKKAEMHLHRQRVERGLRDEMEQRRASQKVSTHSEQLADFDVAEVMMKAMALAQSTSTQPTNDTAANASASSDSFDDNTFYSSQHDTPSSRNVSRLPNDSESDEMRDGSPYEPALEPDPAPAPPQQSSAAPQSLLQNVLYHQQHLGSSTPGSTAALSQPANIVPGLSSEATSSSYPYRHFLPPEVASSQGSGPVSCSESGNTTKENTVDSRDLVRISERLANVAGQRENPLVRAHDLSPIAPQPAHVSPLAIARQPTLAQSDVDLRRGTPAQVAALRKHHSAATSPDSPPQGSRAADKKKGKRKKRKAEKIAAQITAGSSPFIKPEPRSPSPIAAPAFSRPNKRQRQSHRQPSEISYGDARYDQSPVVDHSYQDRYQTRVRREERVVGYERVDETGRREVEPILIEPPRYERVYYDEPRSTNSVRQGLPESPHIYETSYPPRELRPVRPVSRVMEVGSGEPTYYHDGRPSSRTGMRPPSYQVRSQSPVAHERTTSAMLPPRTVASRIVVDAHGNEYFDPPRSTVLRGDYRQVDPSQVYEPTQPPRAAPRRPDMYEDDAALYTRTSPYAVRRRVITQSNFLPQEQRVYREVGQSIPPAISEYNAGSRADSRPALEPGREYIARSSGTRPMVDTAHYDGASAYERRLVEERPYVDSRAASARPPDLVRYEVPVAYERRVGDETMPSYPSMRSASVRPAETVRYELARDYGSRVGSVRPLDMSTHAMHPPPVVRSYSVMPSEAPEVVRRDFSGQALPRYHGRPSVPGDDDVIFLDRHPRDPHRELR